VPLTVLMLGPLEVRRGDYVVDIVGARLRCLLARLALDAGQAVSTSSLIEAVWDDDPPAGAANALQTLVSRLRRSLGDSQSIQQTPAGYRLDIEPDDVDVHRFERAARDGAAALRAAEFERCLAELTTALSWWRGDAFAGLDERRFLAIAISRMTDLRLGAELDRIDAAIALGRAGPLVVDVTALATAHPSHERVIRALMTVLHAAGRQSDALAVYENLRTLLAEEYGTDPSAETSDLHLAVLRGELAVRATPAAVGGARTNLRSPVSSFIGRDDEIARITDLVGANRLVTLIGPGGAGKTRLAAESARRWVADVSDGVWFIELAPVDDAANLAQTVLDSIGVRESHVLDKPGQLNSRDALEQLLDAMADTRAVLVLDNCEHLIGGVARLVDLLLSRNAALRIVATSREPLGIVGEALSIVPPLGQPAPDAGPDVALTFPAVQLFAERAAAVAPGFEVDVNSVGPVIEICRRLDGLPLAIELAAARLRSLPVEQIAARLDDRFRLLTGGSRTAMPRHRTLRAVVEWSWDLLTDPERRLAERLAVFPAGCTPASAEATCAGDGLQAADVFDLLAALVDKSLLQLVDSAEPRYRMLETIREYGIERLAERGELAWIRGRHAAYFSHLANEAKPYLRTAHQLIWMARVNAERDNLLAALRYLGDSGEKAGALNLAGDLSWYWMLRGNHAEAASWLEFALKTKGDADAMLVLTAQASFVLNAVAWFGSNSGDVTPSLDEIADRLDNVDFGSDPLLAILKPMLFLFSHNPSRVGPLLDAAVASEEPWVHAAALMFRAMIAENNGDLDSMRGDLAETLVAFRAIGVRWGLASSLAMLGGLRTLDGDLDGAVESFVEARALLRMIGADDDGAMLSLRIAELRMRRGELTLARTEADRARDLGTRGAPLHSVLADVFAARIARQSGDLQEASALVAEAAKHLERASPSHPGTGLLRSVVLSTSVLVSIDLGLDIGDAATEAYQAAVASKDMPMLGLVGVTMAALAAHDGADFDAAEILGAAARVSGSADDTNVDISALKSRLRAALGDAGFESAYARGRAMAPELATARLDPANLSRAQARLA
jgi:predicted ATPase/DNA-binding SARP family transcriptional activator